MALVEEYHAFAHAGKPFVAGASAVPVSGRVFDASDIKSPVEPSPEFRPTAGRFNDRFQERLAKRIGTRYLLTVNSGWSANLVAFTALTSPPLRDRAIPAGSEVITAATGFPTTVNPCMM